MRPNSAGWRRPGLAAGLIALVAGAATALALAPFHLVPLVFGHGVLLALIARSKDARSAALRAWLWALGYHVAGLHWIANAMLVNAGEHAWLIPFANLGLPAVLAVFAALAGGLARRFFGGGVALWLGFTVLYASVEWVRGHVFTGFPWNLPAAGLDGWLALLQPASLVGAYGLSLLVVLVATAPALWADPHAGRRTRIVGSAVAAIVFAAMAGWGTARLAALPTVDARDGAVQGTVVRIVQGNVPQRDKWNAQLKPGHLARYLALSDVREPATERAPGLTADAVPTVVVWPETAVTHLIGDAPELMRALASAAPPGGSLIFGAPRVARVGPLISIYNSLFAIDSAGQTLWQFDKAHLVPFGEYVPLRGLLPIEPLVQGRRDFTAGLGPRTLDLPGAPPVSPLICYEAIFPVAAVNPDRRPSWLLNATNDAWFGRWSGPHQHLAVARLRAVEQGVAMVRAANTGISSVMDAAGRIVVQLDIGRTGSIDSPLPSPTAPTLFGTMGDIPFFFMVVFTMAIAAYARLLGARRSPRN